MVPKFLCVLLFPGGWRSSNRRRPSCHQQPLDGSAAHHTPCDKSDKQRASVDQQQCRRLLSLPSWRACIKKRRASVSSASSGSEKSAGGNNSKVDACLSRSSLSHDDGKDSAPAPPPIILCSADPPETHNHHTRTLHNTGVGAVSTGRPASRIRDDSMNMVGLHTTTATPANMATLIPLLTSPHLPTMSEQSSLLTSSLSTPSSFSSMTTAPSPFAFPSPSSSSLAHECSEDDDNNHGIMQRITKCLDQRQGQLHEQHEQHQQQMHMHMQQRMEHEHQLQEQQRQRQQHEHKREKDQERREELNTRTRAVFVDEDVGRGGTKVAEGGKSMPIHAGLEMHLTTFCPSEAVQDGHVSLLQLHQHAEQQQSKTGDAMWLSMTENISHEAEKAGEEKSENDSAHGVHCSTLSYIFDSSVATTPLSSSPLPPPQLLCSSTPPMPSADTDYFERSGTSGSKLLDPSIRFEMVERLGYGSSGSSVFKARDRFEDLKTVAIKKIPLSTLAGTSGDHSNNGKTTQSDVDYFVACIVDHTRGGDHDKDNTNCRDNSDGAGIINREDSSTTSRNGNDMITETETRLPSMISKQMRIMDRIVQCLGCHQTDRELWLSLEFCGGGSVEDLIRLSDGPLTESEIGWIMSQVLLGLTFLHSKDHIHGDIKASNILLMLDGQVKIGGSGSVMNHKAGAGERRRHRRSLTMAQLPVSWLTPESTRVNSNSLGTGTSKIDSKPSASAEADIWALGVACIELFRGRPPEPGAPILALFADPRLMEQATTDMDGYSTPLAMAGNTVGTNMGWGNFQTETRHSVRMGMSEEMWSFVARCLTPDPEIRPRVHDLLDDAFILKHNEQSTELQERIQRMREFVDQCAFISSDSSDRQSNDNASISSPSSCSSPTTLSSPTTTYIVDMKLQEANVGPWLIPMVRPRVGSVYDASTFFNEAGLPMSPPDLDTASQLSDWKHQRISHPVVKQALMREQAGYTIFRHSRSPSLATIVESQLEDDTCHVVKDTEIGLRIDCGGRSLR